MNIIKANLELVRLNKAIEKLPLENKEHLLELLDLKASLDMNEMTEYFSRLEESMEFKMANLEKVTNAKYNVLLGMIAFLGTIITVITVLYGFMDK